MKIFRFFPIENGEWSCTSIPDTALLVTKWPFFVPDFTSHCVAQLCCAVRIERLGRSILQPFAHRYYDASAVTLAIHFIARDLYDARRAANLPFDEAVGFDNAVAVAASGNLLAASEASISANGSCVSTPTDALLPQLIDRLLSHTSLFYTLRQGDLLLIPLQVKEQPVKIESQLQCRIGADEVMTVRVK